MSSGAACGAIFAATLFSDVRHCKLLAAVFAVIMGLPIEILVGVGYICQRVRAFFRLVTSLILVEYD